MRSLPSLGLIAAAAAIAAAGAGGAGCGDDERVLIELQGEAPDARRVDVLLLDPVVLGKAQRRNLAIQQEPPVPTLEVVAYLAQRAVVSLDVRGESIDGLRFEVRDAGGPYTPLAIVRDDDGEPIAMGVYSPASITRTEAAEERLADTLDPVGDVAVYAIELEPVAEVAEPEAGGAAVIRRGEVLAVRCGDERALSGLAWRREDGAQIRVAVPLGGAGGAALERIAPPDLDCDDHSPGVRSAERHALGDQLDCDDTAAAVHAAQKEQCSSARLDDDCDPDTTAAEVPCAGPGCSLGYCKCTDANPEPACVTPTDLRCTALATTSGGSQYTPCEGSRGALRIDECSVRDCDLQLVSGPLGMELKLNGAPVGQTVAVAAGRRIELALRATTSYPLGLAGAVVIQVTPKPGDSRMLVVDLELAEGTCSASTAIACDDL